MISLGQVREIVIAAARQLGNEQVRLCEASERVLGENVYSDMDMPPANMSAMDGYACRWEDRDIPLAVVETIRAGTAPKKPVGSGECAKIMTGAIIPEGADCVVKVEDTEVRDGKVHVTVKREVRFIRARGEDVKQGDLVLKDGTTITPAVVATLASVGCDPVTVSRRPVVGMIATGNELVLPSEMPGPGQIRNSNSFQLYAQVLRAGCVGIDYGVARDTPEAIDAALKKGLAECNVLLFSGGVSLGDFDFVPGILKKNGIDLKFEKVAVNTGKKPTVFGVKDGKYFFGLPGNPLSTFVLFEILVRPFLAKMMGVEYRPRCVRARLGTTIKRRKVERTEFVPVSFAPNGSVAKVAYHGSAHFHAYADAEGIVSLPAGISELPQGDTVVVTLI